MQGQLKPSHGWVIDKAEERKKKEGGRVRCCRAMETAGKRQGEFRDSAGPLDFNEMLALGLVLLNGAFLVSSQPEAGTGTPENITVQLIDSKTVEIFWSTSWKNVERYDVTYNPTENRVVSQAAGNSHSIILRELRPNTQYQVTVTAVVGGKNYRSRRLVFRTSHDPNETLDLHEYGSPPTKPTKLRNSYSVTPEVINPDPTAIGSKYTPPTSTTVRGVEIGLVLLALVVWIIAIALFFHRWGKIRMLLPYQPDYKTQQSLKVPGTGTTIVSGCTGTNTSQSHTDGPGCVQHLRWQSRYLEEPTTAKKCSPTRWAHKPRVSSAIFPASPSFFYTRTSAECESPRIMRHAHSHSEFPSEAIPLCQVSQPRSESHENIISITVPVVVASSVNEKASKKKNLEGKCSEQNKNFKNEYRVKDNKEKIFLDENNSSSGSSAATRKSESGEKPLEGEALFLVESSGLNFREIAEAEKPRRYNRSSLRKQKVQIFDDRDLENVPTFESGKILKTPEQENEKCKNPKTLKTAEMKRKAFLRKVSLQDTHVNYNQDYWLDYKKSARFHKSIDLGYLGKEDEKIEKSEETFEEEGNESTSLSTVNSDRKKPKSFISRLLQTPSTLRVSQTVPRKSGSDPVIFPNQVSPCVKCGLINAGTGATDKPLNCSGELLADVIAKCQNNNMQKKKSWFFLPSNENIPLFSERNGLIETEFDVLDDTFDEESLLAKASPADSDDCEAIDFAFCEIKLDEGEGELS